MASPSRKPMYMLREELNELTSLKSIVLLLKTACRLSGDGRTRCQVMEIVQRAQEDHGMEMELWEAGRIFKSLGFRTAVSQGRGRLVLDPAKLEDAYRRTSEEANRVAAKIEDSLRGLEGISETVTELMTRQQTAMDLVNKENEIHRYLFQHRGVEDRLEGLEQEKESLRVEAEKADELERTVTDMQAQVQALPCLETREAKLSGELVDYQSKSEELDLKEEALGHRLRNLERRYRQVEMGELEQAIMESRAELKDLRKQLGEKRSLVSKLFGRDS